MEDDRPPAGAPATFSVVRAAAVLVIFVVAVVVLVDVGTRATVSVPSSAAATTTTVAGHAGGSTTTTTHAASSTTTTGSGHGHKSGATTTTTTAPHSSVSVLVANATSVNGVAAHYSTVIGAGGWNMQTPVDANATEATSAVYYASGQQEAAASIATTIGVPPTAVLPLSTSTPVSYPANTDIVVVIGSDLASKPGA